MIKFRLANYVITVFVIFFVSPAAANWFFEDNSIKGQTVYVANEKNLNVHILQDKEFYQYRFLTIGKAGINFLDTKANKIRHLCGINKNNLAVDEIHDWVNYHPLKILEKDKVLYILRPSQVIALDLRRCIEMHQLGYFNETLAPLFTKNKTLRRFPYAQITGFFCDIDINGEKLSILECNGQLSTYRLPVRRKEAEPLKHIIEHLESMKKAKTVEQAVKIGRTKYNREFSKFIWENPDYFTLSGLMLHVGVGSNVDFSTDLEQDVSAQVVSPSAKWLISGGPEYEKLGEPIIKLGRSGDDHFVYGIFNQDYAYEPSLRVVTYDPFTLTSLERIKYDCGTLFESPNPIQYSRSNGEQRFYFAGRYSIDAFLIRNDKCLKLSNREFYKGLAAMNYPAFQSTFKNQVLFDGDFYNFKTEKKVETSLLERDKRMCRANFNAFDVAEIDLIFSCQNVGWSDGPDLIFYSSRSD